MSKVKDEIMKHFIKCLDDKFLCIHCHKKYASDTSNLKNHLKRLHPIEFDLNKDEGDDPDFYYDVKKVKVEKDDESKKLNRPLVNKTVELPTNSLSQFQVTSLSRKKNLDYKLLRMLVTDFEPFEFVERNGFSDIIKEMYKGEKIPKASDMERQFSALYNSLKEKLYAKLSGVEFVSISVHTWSLSSRNKYLTCSCHFILDEEPRSAVLETRPIDDDSTQQIGENKK